MVTWAYLKGTSQQLALQSRANEILLAGGRGWGKTEVQLMRFRSEVGKGYGTYWRGIIFDREYKNLNDMIVKSKRLFMTDKLGAKWKASASELKWVWSTGEELLFAHIKKSDDYWKYHGHEYAFVGWNELTKYPDPYLYNKMFSVNRTGFDPVVHTPKRLGHNGGPLMQNEDGSWPDYHYKDLDGNERTAKMYGPYMTLYGDDDPRNGLPLPPIPIETVSTTNPYGPGHQWVKRKFIDPAPYGTCINTVHEIARRDPETGREWTDKVERLQVTFHGTYKDNRFLTPEYIAGLRNETDPNVLKAWENGDWNIVAGGALDDVWRPEIHVLPQFKVPATWTIVRALDWGSSHPFSVGWFAIANGEEAELPNGRRFCPPPGTLIQIAEYYGQKGGYKNLGNNEGCKMSATDIAKGILLREAKLKEFGIISTDVYPGPADNQIRNVTESSTDTIEKKFADAGVTWTPSDKSPGSRKIGLELIRERLRAAVDGEGPALYFTQNCLASISLIPVLPRNEDDMDDVDTDCEDHAYDMVRYQVLAGGDRIATNFKVRWT